MAEHFIEVLGVDVDKQVGHEVMVADNLSGWNPERVLLVSDREAGAVQLAARLDHFGVQFVRFNVPALPAYDLFDVTKPLL